MKTDDFDSIKNKVLPILKRHHAKKAGLFGSLVSGQMQEDSDIDILIEIDEDISLLDYIGIKNELEEVLGKKVDLVEYDTIKPLLRDKILAQQVLII